jgi:hypothetical protein
MNKFEIAECIDVNENDYDGPCIIMACVSDPSFMLFFPINKENAKIINFVLKDNSKYDINTNIIGIYKTMVDSWTSSDRFLSGIIMDAVYNEEAKDEVLMIRLALSDADGNIDSLVHVNFLHAMLLSAMERVHIIVSDKLLEKMMPQDEGNEEGRRNTPAPHFPEDKKIVDIAKKIMGGKIKDP